MTHSPDFLYKQKEMMALLLVAIVGISGALTAAYFNQNSRSLRHRYATQERQMRDWLADMRPRLKPAIAAPSSATALAALDYVLSFEDLMIHELLDWISITTHDAIELAP